MISALGVYNVVGGGSTSEDFHANLAKYSVLDASRLARFLQNEFMLPDFDTDLWTRVDGCLVFGFIGESNCNLLVVNGRSYVLLSSFCVLHVKLWHNKVQVVLADISGLYTEELSFDNIWSA